jgi:hypothetical protein
MARRTLSILVTSVARAIVPASLLGAFIVFLVRDYVPEFVEAMESYWLLVTITLSGVVVVLAIRKAAKERAST